MESGHFDSNVDSNAGELWRTLANVGELLMSAVNFKMNPGGPWRTLANDGPANFKTSGRHPWRCRRTDRSRRAPANFNSRLTPTPWCYASIPLVIPALNIRSDSNADQRFTKPLAGTGGDIRDESSRSTGSFPSSPHPAKVIELAQLIVTTTLPRARPSPT